MRPLFLLSLPRSGSTLLQRILTSHPEVASSPEPWLMLPQVYALREHGAYAEYGQVPTSRAIREFADRLPGGRASYHEAVRAFAMDLYRRAAGRDVAYFLDKTPRYHFIAEELFEIFPEGRFVFLWRDPLSVVASVVETWQEGRWKLGRWREDLVRGPAHLVQAYERHRERAFALRFDDLLGEPERTLAELCAHLDIDDEPAMLEAFSDVRWKARMGDPTGTARYATLSTEPLEKWKATIRGPVRTRWARRYLESIGEERLNVMGYDLAALLRELDAQPGSWASLPSDVTSSISASARRSGQRTAAKIMWRGPKA